MKYYTYKEVVNKLTDELDNAKDYMIFVGRDLVEYRNMVTNVRAMIYKDTKYTDMGYLELKIMLA